MSVSIRLIIWLMTEPASLCSRSDGNRIALDLLLQSRIHAGPADHHIDAYAKLLLCGLLEVDQGEGIGGIQADAEVDIAAGSGFIAGQGAEQGQLLDAVEPAPFRQVPAEQGDDLVAAAKGPGIDWLHDRLLPSTLKVVPNHPIILHPIA